MPDPSFARKELAERMLHRRAVEAVIWSMPAVNFELFYQGLVKAKGAWKQVVYWAPGRTRR